MTKNKLFTFMVCLLFAAPIMAQQKLGDIVDFGGVKGMVFKVDNSGEHGLVMTIDKCKESWLKDKDAKFETGAFYEDDGEKNLAAIAKYIEEQNQQWEDFPYFNWCRSLGEGWYPPAKGDGVYDSFTKSPFLYYSSTEADNGWVYVMNFEENMASSVVSSMPFGGGGPKGMYKLKPWQKSQMGGKALNIVGNRAIHKF